MNRFQMRMIQLRRWVSPQQFIAELLGKRWMEPIIPFIFMVLVILMFSLRLPGYLSLESITTTARPFAEFAFVCFGMAITLIAGGIDLSVASIYALTNFIALLLFRLFDIPFPLVIVIVLVCGAILGAVNGVLIGFLKTRAFLTTLVTLLVYRAILALFDQSYSRLLGVKISSGTQESALWDFFGEGNVLGIPTSVVAVLLIAVIGHIFLSRSRWGWRIASIGGGRRAAIHAGIAVEKTIFFTYIISGVLSSIGGLFYATRLNSATSDTAMGYEINALTAVVLGGVSLSGGKGTFGRALIGTVIVIAIMNGFLRLGLVGGTSAAFLGFILLVAVGIDVKWRKNLFKTIQKIYVVPTYSFLPESEDAHPGSGTVFEANNRLSDAEPIGLGEIDGPEDVILDREDRVYGSCRQGWIMRFSGKDFKKKDIFARIGGRPLGMAFDKDDNLIVCVAGMGLYGAHPNGEVYCLTGETNRTWWKLNDDSRLRLCDDLDITPDGKIWFSDASIRYEMNDWPVDSLEGRGNGRLCCYDPTTGKTKTVLRNIVFPNGVCVSHDNQSILYAQTWLCRVMRLWVSGPNKGKIEPVVENLPFYTDNINRTSDGNYWLASVGMRPPAFNLAMQMPGFRKRMVKRIPSDEWLFPNINTGCVVKFTEKGEVTESFWDYESKSHPAVTSMREHKGYLYLAGLHNNRIGRIKIEGADPNWNGPECYYGKK